MTGVPSSPAVEGASIAPTLFGKPQDLSRRMLYWVRREGGPKYFGQDYYAVRRGPWKLLHNSPFEPLELYNLDDDPREQNDVAKSQPAMFRQLARAMSDRIQLAGRTPWQPPA